METSDRTEERPPDSAYFTAVFIQGPLGITFHRAPSSDYVYVKDIVPGSQASKSDILINDRLWAIDEVVIGTKVVTKETWSGYLAEIKERPRPLPLVFRRVLLVDDEEESTLQALGDTQTRTNGNGIGNVSGDYTAPDDISANASDSDSEAAAVRRACSSDLPGTLDNNAELILLNEIRVIASKIIMNSKSIELVTSAATFANNGSGAGGIRKCTKTGAGNQNIIMDFLCVSGRTLEHEGEVGVYRSTGIPAKPIPGTSGTGAAAGTAMGSIMSGITSIFGSAALANPAVAMLTTRSPIGGRRYVHVFNDLLLISLLEEVPAPVAGLPPIVRYQLETIVDVPTCKLRRGEHSSPDMLTSLFVPRFTPEPPPLPQSTAGLMADFYGTGSGSGSAHAGDGPESESESGPVYKTQLLELLHPAGVLFMVCKSMTVRDRWCRVLFKSIMGCMLVQYSGISSASLPLGWHHQYILGTVHSAVIMRDDARIEELLDQCELDAALSVGEGGIGELDGSVAAMLEEPDVDGYAPLHYASMLRQTSTIKLLLDRFASAATPDGGVSVNIGAWALGDADVEGYESAVTCRREWSPLHWAAVQLDFPSLELLAETVFDKDLVLDHRGRNPLVLACLEGRNSRGQSDANSLAKCMSYLIDQHTDLNVLVPDSSLQRREEDGPESQAGPGACSGAGVQINLLHVLASSWEHECCQILLKFQAKMNCIDGRYPGTRPAKYHPFHGFTPLHVAVCGTNMKYALGEGSVVLNSLLQKRHSPAVIEICARIRSGVGATAASDDSVNPYITKSYLGNNVIDGPDMYENGLLTVEYLLLFGARPNLCTPAPAGPDGLDPGMSGGTPLQLLMTHTEKWRDYHMTSNSSPDNYYINKVIKLLMNFGARVPSGSDETWVQQLRQFITPVELEEASNVWNNKPALDSTECPELNFDSYLAFCQPSIGVGGPATPAAGAEVELCQCCQATYSMFKRAHTCRLCAYSCCDDCSKKRVSFASAPKVCSSCRLVACDLYVNLICSYTSAVLILQTSHRICDSCFNRARHSIETADREKRILNMIRISPSKTGGSTAAAPDTGRNSSYNTCEKSGGGGAICTPTGTFPPSSDRLTLFDGARADGSNDTTTGRPTSSTLSGTSAVTAKLSETHQRLQERGEKLNQVADKSSELANASSEFARLAREMKAQQSKSWF